MADAESECKTLMDAARATEEAAYRRGREEARLGVENMKADMERQIQELQERLRKQYLGSGEATEYLNRQLAALTVRVCGRKADGSLWFEFLDGEGVQRVRIEGKDIVVVVEGEYGQSDGKPA